MDGESERDAVYIPVPVAYTKFSQFCPLYMTDEDGITPLSSFMTLYVALYGDFQHPNPYCLPRLIYSPERKMCQEANSRVVLFIDLSHPVHCSSHLPRSFFTLFSSLPTNSLLHNFAVKPSNKTSIIPYNMTFG